MVIQLTKTTKKYGNTVIIQFNVEERQIHDIKVGDIFNVELERIEKEDEQDGNNTEEEEADLQESESSDSSASS